VEAQSRPGHPAVMLPGRRVLACLAIIACRTDAAAVPNGWVDAKDLQTAADARVAATLYCTSQDANFDEARARERLEAGVGGNNFMLEILQEAKTQDELGSKTLDNISVSFIVTKVAPIVAAFFFLVLWPFCVIFSCPCCKCCRCGRKERTTSRLRKIILWILLAAICLGLIICASLGRQGYDANKDGFQTTACTGAGMLDNVLSGKDDPYFIGLVPTLNQFDALVSKLNNGSSFLAALDVILDSTLPIAAAADLASEVLDLLSSALVNPANTASNRHQCIICGPMAVAVSDASVALSSGIASALKNARAEVALQLGPTKRVELQDTIRSGSSSLVDFKKIIRETFSFLIDKDGFDAVMVIFENQVFWALNILFICAFLLLICAASGASCFTARERADADRGKNPYCKSVHRCSCLVWQCGFLYVIAAFALGGILGAVMVPMAGVCLVMDDLSGDLLRSIGPAINQNFSDSGGTMLLNIVDNCLVPADRSLNANMLDLINTTDSNNQSVTMRRQIVDMVAVPINAQFDAISAMSDDNTTLADSPPILSLRSFITSNPMDAMLIPDNDFTTDAVFSKFSTDNRGSTNGLEVGYQTSSRCTDLATANLPAANLPLRGITHFVTVASAKYGAQQASADCVKNVDCTGNAAGDMMDACNAANAFLNLKRTLRAATTFRCDLFELDSGATCDPKSMTQVGSSGVWLNDCLRSDGTLVRKQITCSFADFVTYVNDFDTRIQRTMDRLDLTVVSTQSNIDVGLRNLVNTQIVGLIVNTTAGVNCGFMTQTYRGIVKGFCYQGVVGMGQISNSYVFSAVLVTLLMLMTYALWRRSVDNVNAWDKNKVVPIENVQPMTNVVPDAKQITNVVPKPI